MDMPTPENLYDNLDLEGIITYRIFRLHAALDRQAVHILNNVSGLRQNEWKVISFIGLGAAHTSRDIARFTHMDPAIISRTIRTLEDDGLVITERSKDDRRVVLLSLSEAGQKKFELTFPHMLDRHRSLLSSLSSDEQELIWKILDNLETATEQLEFN